MKILSSERRQRAMPIALARAARTVPVQVQVVTIDPARAAITDQAAAASTDLVVAPKCKTWIVRPRIDSVADNRANASRTSNAAAVIASVVAEDSAVIDSAAVDLAVFAAAGDSGADDEN